MSSFEQEIGKLSPKRLALLCVEMKAELDSIKEARREPIAIVGMGCRFPGRVNSPEGFWDLMRNDVDAISEVPAERWDKESYYDPHPDAAGKMYCWEGGFLNDVDQFDNHFFDISPREAVNIDPQQRLLLEVSWEALEYAGIAPTRLSGSRTGVFVGISLDDYARIQMWKGDPEVLNAYTGTGSTFSCAAGRISYLLGLNGPSLSLDTACSSSLVAVHLACQSLRSRECDLALAGGVNLMLSPDSFIFLCKARALAPDGRCKSFDSRANGYARSEGCGMVALRRLSDALAQGDNILALIKGTAVNHDGASSGFTVPNGSAQEAVIRAALADARIDPYQVSCIEAHGTGTALGDPIEVQALAQVLGHRDRKEPILLGSVKTNIGHAESAAGVAGLIKMVLMLRHRMVPAHLHLREVNQHIHLDEGPFVIPACLSPWNPCNGKRVGGVSSFGLSGTNAHVVLEEAAPARQAPAEIERPLHVLTLSTQHEESLPPLIERFRERLLQRPEDPLADVCFTANTGRTHLNARLVVTADSRDSLAASLQSYLRGEKSEAVRTIFVKASEAARVAFLFTGQGSQYGNMGRELYQTQPTFRRVLEECDEILKHCLDRRLLEILYSPGAASSPLNSTVYTQPALFAVEYALAQLLHSWGIEPAFVLGHSLGEYVAACVAGVFSLEDGLKLVADRAKLMQALPQGGRMAAVFAGEAQVRDAIAPWDGQVSIAAINGPRHVVISGDGGIAETVVRELRAQNIESRWLNVSHAFHSPLMAPVLESFERRAAKDIRYAAPRIRLISNLTGQVASTNDTAWPEYWSRHLAAPVRFSDGVQTLYSKGCRIFIEVGPNPVLLGMARSCVVDDSCLWSPTLREGRGDWRQLLRVLEDLYLQGLEINWQGFDRDYPRRKVILPTYPWKRKRCWLQGLEKITLAPRSGVRKDQGDPQRHPLLGRRLNELASLPQHYFWESDLDTQSLSYLEDHHMGAMPVAPMALFLEMAQVAAREAFQDSAGAVKDVTLHKPLLWTSGGARSVQVSLQAQGEHALLSISSRPAGSDTGRWTLHATAKIPLNGGRASAKTGREA